VKEELMEANEAYPQVQPELIDLAIEECAISRANFYLGLWAARQLGLGQEELSDYARTVVAADFEEPGTEDVVRKLVLDFTARGVVVSRDELRRQLRRTRALARRQFAASD
jgi:hypothetical protein